VVPREEEQARKEFEREKAQLLKERSHYEAVLLKVTDQGGDTTELQQRLVDVDDAITGVEAREANVRAGYIYVISNIGARGPFSGAEARAPPGDQCSGRVVDRCSGRVRPSVDQ
jgi:hypothetical protein